MTPTTAHLLQRLNAPVVDDRGRPDDDARSRRRLDVMLGASDEDAAAVLAECPGLWQMALLYARSYRRDEELVRIGIWARDAIRLLIARDRAQQAVPLLAAVQRHQPAGLLELLEQCLSVPALHDAAVDVLHSLRTEAAQQLLRQHGGRALPTATEAAARIDDRTRFRTFLDTFLAPTAPWGQRLSALHYLLLSEEFFSADILARFEPVFAGFIEHLSLPEAGAVLNLFAERPGSTLIPLLAHFLRQPGLRNRTASCLMKLPWAESRELLGQIDLARLHPDVRLQVILHDPAHTGLDALLGPGASDESRLELLDFLAMRGVDLSPVMVALVERCLDDGVVTESVLVRLAAHPDASVRRRLFDRLWSLVQPGSPPLPWDVDDSVCFTLLVRLAPAPDLVASLLDATTDRDWGRALVKAIALDPDPHLIPALERWAQANPTKVAQKAVERALRACRSARPRAP